MEDKVSQFGVEIRSRHFAFAEGYRPLNHGSFGTIPKMVLEYQRQLQLETEARPDTSIRYTYLKLLKESRSAVAPLLGADPGEVVFVPNATTGVNTVLRNLSFSPGEVVLCFNTIYGACSKTIQAISETSPVSIHEIEITYPIQDDEIVRRFRLAVDEVKAQGKHPKLAMFDTVLTFPGARFPWEALVATCKELGIMSFIDGAHGIGHIDLTNLGEVGPDFMVSNYGSWSLGVALSSMSPFRNQHLITTTFPTSWGYETPETRKKMDPREYFSRLFDKVSTTDNTPYCCISLALKFRSEVCGGEDRIFVYCQDIARRGGAKMAEIMGTEVLGRTESSFQRCCFTNVRLPLTLEELGVDEDGGRKVAKWMQELRPAEHETYIPIKMYAGQFWCRISGQVYLTMEDFEWAAGTLLQLCDQAKKGEWK